MALEEVSKLQHDIGRHIAEAEQAMQVNGLSLEQSILQALYKKPPVETPSTPPATPDQAPK